MNYSWQLTSENWVSPLLSLQLNTSQELRLSGHNLPLSWQKHSGSRIAPKTLNSWASMWTIWVEPERETAPCPATLCHDSHQGQASTMHVTAKHVPGRIQKLAGAGGSAPG